MYLCSRATTWWCCCFVYTICRSYKKVISGDRISLVLVGALKTSTIESWVPWVYMTWLNRHYDRLTTLPSNSIARNLWYFTCSGGPFSGALVSYEMVFNGMPKELQLILFLCSWHVHTWMSVSYAHRPRTVRIARCFRVNCALSDCYKILNLQLHLIITTSMVE